MTISKFLLSNIRLVINLCSVKTTANMHRRIKFVELFQKHTSWTRLEWSDEYSQVRPNDEQICIKHQPERLVFVFAFGVNNIFLSPLHNPLSLISFMHVYYGCSYHKTYLHLSFKTHYTQHMVFFFFKMQCNHASNARRREVKHLTQFPKAFRSLGRAKKMRFKTFCKG